MKFDAPENITIEEFVNNYLMEKGMELLKSTDLSWLSGREIAMNFDIGGEKFGARLANGTDLEIVSGGIADAMVAVGMSEKFWRSMATGKQENGLEGYMLPIGEDLSKERFDQIETMKCTMSVDIENDNGDVETVKFVFNNANPDETDASIKIGLSDWLDLRKKETDGPTLVMQGKLDFDGDMALLLEAQDVL